jgi:acyl carrier protein
MGLAKARSIGDIAGARASRSHLRRTVSNQPNPRGGAKAAPASRQAKGGSRMSSTQTLETVRQIMEDVFDVDDLSITEATTAEDIEEWDSLSHIRLIVAIERKFGIKFKNAEIEGLMNVGDLVRVIDAKIG